jgi:hypothetical protein
MTTTRQVQARYPNNTVEQVDSKQCWYVYFGTQNAIALSYETIVGCYVRGVFYLTTEKYSNTTTAQCTRMSRDFNTVKRVDADELQLIVAANIIF